MGEYSDQASGRVKQAAGALTGDEETKREGEREEKKGQLKEKLNEGIDKAEGALGKVKDKISGA